MTATTDLVSTLMISGVTFLPNHRQEMSRQAGGVTRVKDIGPALWGAKVSCTTMSPEDVEAAAALVGSLSGSLGTFLLWHPAKQYPRLDLAGTILGASTVQINSLPTDTRTLSLKGLPAGYVLSRGDFLSFVWSTTHRALHQVVAATVTADGSGVTPAFEVHPAIRTGAAVNDAVSLARPTAEMMIVPGSWDASHAPMIGQCSFEAVQVA